MELNTFSRFALAAALLLQCARAALPEEVANRVGAAVIELSQKTLIKNPQEVSPVASSYLQGYTDAERIRGFAAWMYRDKSKDRVNAPTYAGNLLLNDPNVVKDFSELRKLIATEEDPERFFLLCLFSGYIPDGGEDFISEMARMLFRHGRVSPKNSNTTSAEVLGDVGAFTYKEIVIRLRDQHASFDESAIIPNGMDSTAPEKIMALAKWLKKNWPGCENLEIPGESLIGPGESSVGSGSAEQAMAARDPKPRAGVSEPASSRPADRHILLWVTAGGISILAGTIIVCHAKRRAKR